LNHATRQRLKRDGHINKSHPALSVMTEGGIAAGLNHATRQGLGPVEN
jgi:hypothetical protein